MFLSWATDIDFARTDFTDEAIWFCTSVYDLEVPVVVIVFEFVSPFDAHFTLAVADPRGLSRQLITAIYRAVFQKAARITANIRPDNEVAIRQVWRMGFKPEGYLRRGYDGVHDASVWGLLPEDCPYLQGKPFRYRWVQPTHEQAQRMQ
jgi:RimJ/RimL family protein N-acetyltransferase